jgi:hypothetical protein
LNGGNHHRPADDYLSVMETRNRPALWPAVALVLALVSAARGGTAASVTDDPTPAARRDWRPGVNHRRPPVALLLGVMVLRYHPAPTVPPT